MEAIVPHFKTISLFSIYVRFYIIKLNIKYEKEEKQMSQESITTRKNRKSKEKIAWITCLGMIVAAMIGTISISINVNTKNEKLKTNYEEIKSENTDLACQTSEYQEAYRSLNSQYEALLNQNSDLQNRISSLEVKLSQSSSLVEENASLKNKLENLQIEVQNLKDKYENQENMILGENDVINELTTPARSSGKKVSIFDLDTFQGHTPWSLPYDESYYTDTYENEYVTAHIGIHDSKTKEDYYVPTYLLDNKYTLCEGQIAWSKHDKNSTHSAWIEFYSGDDLIYTTDIITPTDRIVSFSFSVEELETLTIVTNSTINTVNSHVYIIYPYLNLVE